MAVKKVQKNRMNASGTFDVIHYETEASQVLMSDGTTAETAISGKETAGAAAQALTDAKSYTDNQIAGIPTPDVSGQINTHNTSETAHADLFASKADLVNGVVPVSQLPNEVKECRIVADIAARDAITDKFANLNVYVKDASGDPTVDSGGAYYLYDGSAWIKTGESESMDVVQSWSNITDKPVGFTPSEHTHEQSDVVGLENALANKQNTIVGTKGQIVGFDDDGKPVAQDAPDIPSALSDLSEDENHRVVTDSEKIAWNDKQNALSGEEGQIVCFNEAGKPVAASKKIYAVQDTEPDDTCIIWIDTGNGGIMKYHNGTEWVTVSATW